MRQFSRLKRFANQKMAYIELLHGSLTFGLILLCMTQAIKTPSTWRIEGWEGKPALKKP